MDRYEVAYQNAVLQVEAEIASKIYALEAPDELCCYAVGKSESTLDAWDYCYAIAIGLSGVSISTNTALGDYLDQIHKAASGASGEYDRFQNFLGQALHHKGDHMDTLGGPFQNRKGGNAYCLFHRLLWGHDILDVGADNPFRLMYAQDGWRGIIQAVRHLLADTASKQGLPFPGSSYFDYTDENNKTSNYLIKIAQQLSSETTGNKAKAQEIYSHIATIRMQDITAGMVVKAVTELYFLIRGIKDEIRRAEIRLIAYAVNFFGEAAIGCVRQNGVPYINIPLGSMLATSFGRFCYLNHRDIVRLQRTTDELSKQTENILSAGDAMMPLPVYSDSEAIIAAYAQAESNIDELMDFFEEDAP